MAEFERDPAAVQVIGGLPMEITRRLLDSGVGIGTFGAAGSYVFTDQSEFKFLLLQMMEEAGVRLMLHSLIVDVLMDEGSIQGIVVENKSGRQALLAKLVIDATGDGDVAARAGAPYVVGVAEGDLEDILSQREFADGIGKGCHPIDIQPIPDSLKRYPLAHRWSFNIPYRCLLPKKVDNLLLAGRCISNTHEASGCTRPTVQCMVTGEAAGTAAAMCLGENVRPLDLDTDRLRERLAAQGVHLQVSMISRSKQ